MTPKERCSASSDKSPAPCETWIHLSEIPHFRNTPGHHSEAFHPSASLFGCARCRFFLQSAVRCVPDSLSLNLPPLLLSSAVHSAAFPSCVLRNGTLRTLQRFSCVIIRIDDCRIDMKPAVVKGIIVGKSQIAYCIMESSASDQVACIQRVPGKLRILQKVLCIPGTTGIFEALIFLEVVNLPSFGSVSSSASFNVKSDPQTGSLYPRVCSQPGNYFKFNMLFFVSNTENRTFSQCPRKIDCIQFTCF